MLNRNIKIIHHDIISKIIDKCNTIHVGAFPKVVKILYGNSISLNTLVLEKEIKERIQSTCGVNNLIVKFQQFPTQIICEWCSMVSLIDNSQYVCHYCGKETEVFVNDKRLIIKYLSDDNSYG